MNTSYVRIQTKEYAQEHLLDGYNNIYLLPTYLSLPDPDTEDAALLMQAGVAQKDSPDVTYLTGISAIFQTKYVSSYLISVLFYTYGLVIESIESFKMNDCINIKIEFTHEVLQTRARFHSVSCDVESIKESI